MELTLMRFEATHAELVAGWADSQSVLDSWASRTDFPLAAQVIQRWHEDPQVHPFVAVSEGKPVGYGEIWTDGDEDEAELARVLIQPEARGRRVGRKVIAMLAAESRNRGFTSVVLRVVPSNLAAIRCYGHAGFRRMPLDEERALNEGQPRAYVWMRSEHP